jgi:hypothetical protein
MEQSKNKTKKKRKTAIIFASKQNGSKIFFASMQNNESETDLVSLRSALKRKNYFCETGAP